MKKWIRLTALLLTLLMLLSALMGCQVQTGTPGTENEEPDTENQTPDTENNQPSDSEDTTPDKEEVQRPLLDPANAVILANSKATQYVIIRDNSANAEVKQMVMGFRNAFWIKTGADIQVMDDTTRPIEKEIIVSVMDGREESGTEFAKLTAPKKKGYRIGLSGDKIVVAAEEEFLQDALDLLLRAISDCGNGIWGLPKKYVGSLDIPKIAQYGDLYKVSAGNYAYNVANASSTVMKTLSSDLERDGFTLYTKNQIGNSEFKTYIKDSIYGDMVVYLMYHPEIKTLRLTYGPMEYLPNVMPLAADNKATPTVTQMYMQMMHAEISTNSSGQIVSSKHAPGMSYVIQLSDGRFIVIDGGNADGEAHVVKYDETTGKWTATADKVKTNDAKRLYDTMNAMKPASHSKPHIAAWFISHPHADHMYLAVKFLKDYVGKVKLDLVGYNFPEYESAKIVESRRNAIQNFCQTAQETYGAKLWNMHTGQTLELPGAKVEVLSTVEDYYCTGSMTGFTKEIEINYTCVVFRIFIGNMSFMVLGDSYAPTETFMADAYGDAMQSDIMQVSHHGYNGGVMELYEVVDPKICFWPSDDFRFSSDSVLIGSQSGTYRFNWWLRNKPWTRENGKTGDRTHYTASYITTINALTGTVTKVPAA